MDEIQNKMQRVDALVERLEREADEKTKDQIRELMGTLMEFHAKGLHRILEILEVGAANFESLYETMGRDPLSGSLLMFYDCHPASVAERVDEALNEVRPTLQKHLGDVELMEVSAPMVHLKLKGTCNGCPSSTTTFKNLIEEAIYQRAPEIEFIQVEGMA